MRSFSSLFEAWSPTVDTQIIARLQQLVPTSDVVLDTAHDGAPERILTRGQLFRKVQAVLDRGDHACHENCTELWNTKKYPKSQYQIATGYYLDLRETPRPRWRSHSWLVDSTTDEVIETTGNHATHYYGIVLTDKEAERYAQHGGAI